MSNAEQRKRAVKLTLPVFCGYIVLGIAFGATLAQAGYGPVCPMLMFSCFLKLEDPKARTEMLGMCKPLMSKCWCLFVCGDPGCEDIARDIATAKALHVEVMSLSGIIDFGGKS